MRYQLEQQVMVTDKAPSKRRTKGGDPPRWRRRLKRALWGTAIATPVGVLLLWLAVHRYPWLGPAIADGLRSVLGTETVSRIEDFVYGVEDRWNRWWREDEAPKAYWKVPASSVSASAAPPTSSNAAGPDAGPPEPLFRPADVGPMFKALAAAGDGTWVPIPDPVRPSDPPRMYKTLIHPDAKRPWAELFVVAMDLPRLQLHLVAGTVEPRSGTQEARAYQRSGVIPSEHRDGLLAAFNGGFKTEHGRWGMRIAGVTLIPGRAHGCTITMTADHALRIAPWQDIEGGADHLTWWRQTPPCMILEGKRHGGLWDPDAKGWGAALEGDTVIRRSAMGLDEAAEVLFVSMTNHTSAQALADGMRHAGSHTVAQLDVNWSFPRFVIFPRGADGKRQTQSLFEGFEVDAEDYLTAPAQRDFFYVLRADAAPR